MDTNRLLCPLSSADFWSIACAENSASYRDWVSPVAASLLEWIINRQRIVPHETVRAICTSVAASKKSFYIIDGHAQIFRAFFAPFRDLSSPTGEPTKATYVFVQMLLNLIQQRNPDYLCMVIDSGDETVFRREFYPEYKANRTAKPPDLAPQEARILQIVRDAGIPIFVKPGYEADDLIATMARRLCDMDFEIFMVSKDKDLRQILSPCTHMYDVQNDEIIDEAKLQEKLGFTPAEAIEVQTLMGDVTDNVPGIPGVGEKTAVKLVRKYGSSKGVLEHLDELTPKLKENFQAHAAQEIAPVRFRHARLPVDCSRSDSSRSRRPG